MRTRRWTSSSALLPPLDSTPVNTERALEPFSGSARRSNVVATSSASSGRPSWNVTPSRILNVQTLPSSLGSQLSAKRGCGWRSRSDQIKNSPVWPRTVSPPWLLTVTGSRAPAGAIWPTRIVPPRSGGAVCGGSASSSGSRGSPQAAARKPTIGTPMPMVAALRTNSRRPDAAGAVLVDEMVREVAASPPESPRLCVGIRSCRTPVACEHAGSPRAEP